jgi:hypothetical protein
MQASRWAAASLLATLVGITSPSLLLAQAKDELGPVVTNKFYSASGKWMQASNTNCVLWNSFPTNGESVTWSGNLLDGKAHGKGIIQWFTNGVPTTSYIGEVKGGLADGHGLQKTSEKNMRVTGRRGRDWHVPTQKWRLIQGETDGGRDRGALA